MNHRVTKVVLAALGALVAAGMLAQQAAVTISKDDQTTTIDCNNNAITVSGDDNKVTAKGQCTVLTVSGDDNVITADSVNQLVVSGDDNNISLETVARISASGDDNNIKWKKGVGDRNPEITNSGEDNKIDQNR